MFAGQQRRVTLDGLVRWQHEAPPHTSQQGGSSTADGLCSYNGLLMELRVPEFLVDWRQNFIGCFPHTNGLIDTSAASGLQRLTSLEELDCASPVVPVHSSWCKHKTPPGVQIFTNYIWRVHMRTKIKAFHLFSAQYLHSAPILWLVLIIPLTSCPAMTSCS